MDPDLREFLLEQRRSMKMMIAWIERKCDIPSDRERAVASMSFLKQKNGQEGEEDNLVRRFR